MKFIFFSVSIVTSDLQHTRFLAHFLQGAQNGAHKLAGNRAPAKRARSESVADA